MLFRKMYSLKIPINNINNKKNTNQIWEIMKKKFLTGMLLGTLALSATPFVVGCSDDDDISRLEEQMATNQNTATVDKNELLNLINETKAALEEQLELAVSGKADSQEVIDLQAKVTALTEQLNAASEGAAEQITSLIEQINGLVADVNKVSGDLDAQKVELEGEIAAVKEALDKANTDNSASTQELKDQLASLKDELAKLNEQVGGVDGALDAQKQELQNQIAAVEKELGDAIAGNSEKIASMTEELTDLQNELKNVNTLIEKNGESIADLTLKIENLEGLTAKVEALESSSENYASEINEINTTLQSVVSGYATIEQELRGKIDALSQQMSSLVAESDFSALAERVTTLETYKNEALQTALNGKADADDLSAALLRITTLEGNMGSYDLSAIDAEIEQLKSDYNSIIGMINAQIQSFMYIPASADRTVDFSYLLLDIHEAEVEEGEDPYADGTYKQLASPVKKELRFRVSPAAAAADFADNYTVSFEKYQQRSIDDDVFAIELVSADASTGIVTFSVTVANPESLTDGTTAWSSCLFVRSAESDSVMTDLSSDFFTLTAEIEKIEGIYANSESNVSNKELVVEDAESISYPLILCDNDGDFSLDENLLDSYDIAYSVAYKFVSAEADADFFTFTTEENAASIAVAQPLNSASYNKTAHIEATLTVTAEGKNYDFVTTYQTVTLVAKTVFEGTLEPISFKFEEGLDKTFSIDEIAECVGIDKALLTTNNFTQATLTGVTGLTATWSADGIKLEVSENTGITLPEGDIVTITLNGQNGQSGKTITLDVAIDQVMPAMHTFLTKEDDFGTQILYNYDNSDGWSASLDIKDFFNDTQNTDTLEKYYGNGAFTIEYTVAVIGEDEEGDETVTTVNNSATEAGVSLNDGVITIDNDAYAGNVIRVTAEADLNSTGAEIATPKAIEFTVQPIATRWSQAGAPATLGKGESIDLAKGLMLSTTVGAKLDALNGVVDEITLWKDGADYTTASDATSGSAEENALATAFGTSKNLTEVYGVDNFTVSYKIVEGDAYVTLSGSTITMKDLETAPNRDVTIKAEITIAPTLWGVSGMPANGTTTVTFTIPQAEWSK